MRIAYNGLQFCGPMNGTRRYSQTSFEQIIRHDPRNQYVLYTYTGAPVYPDPRGFEERCYPSVAEMLLRESSLGDRPRFDVLHMPHPFHSARGVPLCVSMLLAPVGILTMLDLILYRTPAYVSEAYHEDYTTQLRISTAWADRIIAISEHTRRDVVRELGVDGSRVEVVYPGIDPRFEVRDEPGLGRRMRERYAGGSPYVLCLANFLAHKNVRTLVAAFQELVRTTDLPHKLVLVGRPDPASADYRAVLEAVRAHELGGRILLAGAIEEDALVACYNGADLFVYPSLQEGFGLPPLEAMACGVPVVASDATAIPEAVGDAGVLVDATRVEELARGMLTALRDPSLRSALIEKGRARAAGFTWERSARRHVAIYERAFAQSQRDPRPKLSPAWRRYLASILRRTPSAHLSPARPERAAAGEDVAVIRDPTLAAIIHRIRRSPRLERALTGALRTARTAYGALARWPWPRG